MVRSAKQLRWGTLTLAAVLAVGAVAVWLFAAAFVTTSLSHLYSHQVGALLFTVAGEPVIQTGGPNATIFRTLDGKELDAESLVWQNSSTDMPGPDREFVDEAPWPQRIAGFHDHSATPSYWYLVYDGRPQGHGYFVGYDRRTSNLLGYIGTQGFRPHEPGVDEQFVVDRRLIYYGLFVGGSSSWGREPSTYYRDLQSIIALVSDGDVFEINLRDHSVKARSTPGKVVALGEYYEPVPGDKPDKVERLPRLAVRLDDRLLLSDFEGPTLHTVMLPEELRSRVLEVYRTIGQQTILVASTLDYSAPRDIYWLDDHGQIVRRDHVALHPPRNPRLDSVGTAALFPSPALLAIAYGWVVPRGHVANGTAADLAEAYETQWAAAWPTLLSVVLLSAVLALWCYRRQTRYSPSGALVWASFVLVMGPPGLVAFLVHRNWPARAACPSCGTIVPRNRAECLVCSREFPLPELRGTEILA